MGKLTWGMRACGPFLLWALTAVALPAQTLTTLHSFDGTDGQWPRAGLVQATDGNLYGTTSVGGTKAHGTVFRITPSGTLTLLHTFQKVEGSEPYATLIQAPDGNFYGTTYAGGAYTRGAVFKITPDGTVTNLYSFCPQRGCLDGSNPYGVLVQGRDGNLYGTTSAGGTSSACGSLGCGTVFKITPSGNLTTLYNFCSQGGVFCTDGRQPEAGLVLSRNGDLYGTTVIGGTIGAGTVFKITPSGTLSTVYSFCSQSNCTDGAQPLGVLVQGTDGNFYGTTGEGGTSNEGTVFKITPGGALTTLHNFDGTDGGGTNGDAGLVQATDGNFYGTTYLGGAKGSCTMVGGCGTVFKITPSGTLTTLYSFCSQSNCMDGEYPAAGLIQATDGNLYGTTLFGGTIGAGTVFSLSVGLGPFVETQPASGKVGAAVRILGTNLTGATSVTFNDTMAPFTVVSASEITTTVPTGATTGTVQVVTPDGTLSSNVPFTVTP